MLRESEPLTAAQIRGPALFEISKMVRDVPVVGDTRDLEPGMVVSVEGTFQAEGPQVLLDEIEIHRLRWAKKLLSILAMLGVLIGAPVTFRWHEGRLEERLEAGRKRPQNASDGCYGVWDGQI